VFKDSQINDLLQAKSTLVEMSTEGGNNQVEVKQTLPMLQLVHQHHHYHHLPHCYLTWSGI
jgi:hypothetical protein